MTLTPVALANLETAASAAADWLQRGGTPGSVGSLGPPTYCDMSSLVPPSRSTIGARALTRERTSAFSRYSWRPSPQNEPESIV